MATKALHLGIVSDLTAFSSALRRFVSRRPKVKFFYTDNGTNFVKSNRILQELSKMEMENFEAEVQNKCLKRGFKLHFSPPSSAHFNGLVKAAVKSTKFHLYRTFKNITLTYEELSTALCKIEAILNSRPIYEMSNDPNDLK